MDLKNQIPFSRVISAFLTGGGAGVAGGVVLAIVIFLSWSVMKNTVMPSSESLNEFGVIVEQPKTHPLFLHFVVLAVFLGTMVANLAYILLSTVTEKRFSHRATLLNQTFFGNLIFLVLMFPVYLITSNVFGTYGIGAAAVIHAILTSLFTFFVLEALNERTHMMVHVYGALLGLMIFFFFATLLAKNTSALAFSSLPLLYGFLAMGNTTAQSIYLVIYRAYGSDFLNSETRFGEDYGKDNSEENMEMME